MKYSDFLAKWLKELGYTHCFFVGGGNIMHLVDSLSRYIDCRAVVNEVAAGIAAEYFNEASQDSRALALVTAGPGLTNIVTAMAGAYLESRALLVIGGQVKTTDLSRGMLRQRGIQEIDGALLVKSICKRSIVLERPVGQQVFEEYVASSWEGRPGPVFIEIPLDVQGVQYETTSDMVSFREETNLPMIAEEDLENLVTKIQSAKRPVFLLGGGVSRETANSCLESLEGLGIPIMTTWNAADRLDALSPAYFGRPNTWGQRSANLIMQQADLLLAMGSRLGLQQTGFNWQQFVPLGEVIQVDIDAKELEKGHPRMSQSFCVDANDLLSRICRKGLGDHLGWFEFARNVRERIPLVESINHTGDGFLSPFDFVEKLSDLANEKDVVIPCSSGGAFTVMMQVFAQKKGQVIITNKGLASMGYGLSGAIGAAVAHPDKRTILVEGDGGFAQNLQEIGTAAINRLNLKLFIFDDSGYASIRMTQRNYFQGRYVGCDRSTGLGLPDWEKLFDAWDVPVLRIGPGFEQDRSFMEAFSGVGMHAFIVGIDPEQTYYPKITSRVTETGTMESNPLHLMTPDLSEELNAQVMRYLR